MDAIPSALATYSVQILLMVVSAACASAMIRVRAPHVRLIYWRFILAVCLLLPLAPPHIVHVDVATGTHVTAAVTGARDHLAGAQSVSAATAAVWGLMARIQLCREETVDALAVSITASRRLYMQALLAFADSTPPPLMAAPLFARRRHLVVRIRQLSQEVVMSPRRIVFSAAALLAIIAACGWTVVSALPVRTELRARPDVSRAATDIALPAARAIQQPAAQQIVPSTQTTVRPAPPPPPPPPPA